MEFLRSLVAAAALLAAAAPRIAWGDVRTTTHDAPPEPRPFDLLGLLHTMRLDFRRLWQLWTERARSRQRLSRGLGHLTNRVLSAAWSSWSTYASDRSESLRQLRMGASRLVLRHLSLGFGGWVAGWVSELARQHSLAQIARALQRMLGRQMSRGWTAWVSMCDEAARVRLALRAVALRRALAIPATAQREHVLAVTHHGELLRLARERAVVRVARRRAHLELDLRAALGRGRGEDSESDKQLHILGGAVVVVENGTTDICGSCAIASSFGLCRAVGHLGLAERGPGRSCRALKVRFSGESREFAMGDPTDVGNN